MNTPNPNPNPAPVTFAVTVNEPGVTQTHTAALDPAQHDEAAAGLLLFGLASRALRALDLPAPVLAAEQDDTPTPADLAAALRNDMDTASTWDAGEDEALREAADALARAARAIVDADAALESAEHRAASAGQSHRLQAGRTPAWRAVVDAVAPLADTWAVVPVDVVDDAMGTPEWERFRLVRRALAHLAEFHGFEWSALAPRAGGGVPVAMNGNVNGNPWSAAFTVPPTGDPADLIRVQVDDVLREAREVVADDAEDAPVTDAAGLTAAVRQAMKTARAEDSARPSSGGRHVRPDA